MQAAKEFEKRGGGTLTKEDKKQLAAAAANLSDEQLAHRHEEAVREVVQDSVLNTTRRVEETCKAAGKARADSELADKDKDVSLRDAFAKVGRYASHDARFSRPSALRSSVGTSHC